MRARREKNPQSRPVDQLPTPDSQQNCESRKASRKPTNLQLKGKLKKIKCFEA